MGREKVYGTPGAVDLVVLKQRPECAWTILLIWQVLVVLLWPVSQGSPESPVVGCESPTIGTRTGVRYPAAMTVYRSASRFNAARTSADASTVA